MDKKLAKSMITAIVVLPGSALVLIPAAIMWLSAGTPYAPSLPSLPNIIIGVVLALPALVLMASSMSLFMSHGKGTPAPWEPPRKLVIRGPYRHVRNPMLTGVILFQFSEAALFSSWPLAVWAFLFALGNAIYFPLVEEKGLEKRFGDDYLEYKKNVPRWIPRLRPWSP